MEVCLIPPFQVSVRRFISVLIEIAFSENFFIIFLYCFFSVSFGVLINKVN